MADLYPPYMPSSSSSDDAHDNQKDAPPKPDTKPQATFLTKLYALLERPENHHMIRWDPAGEHIIVERPEQLALHVLPSIYRQSRFASFSRQLNIYGFMRKVNLRNVDPAIDDPDASTWSHPTLNRHSPPEVVANFKRRVPPRLPKPRKRDVPEQNTIPPPRTAMPLGSVPLKLPQNPTSPMGRARGFSAPGAYTPLTAANPSSWASYSRSALPPLMVPSDPPQQQLYGHAEDSATNYYPPAQSSQHYYGEQSNWSFSASSSHNSSLSSLLNPTSNGYQRPAPTINTSYASPFSSMPMQGEHSASSMSPDSRPTTGYSISSVSSLPYQDDHMHDYSRPGSSHHRPISPARPGSSKGSFNPASLSIRRARRHSQAMSPYPSPYDGEQRPSSSPQPPIDDHPSSGIPRVRSMIQLPSVDPYGFSSHTPQAEFAYSAQPSSMEGMNDGNGWAHRNVRPSTSTSSISAASHTSSSQANTPPVAEYSGETDINRFSPDFGFVPMTEHLPHYSKVVTDL